MHRFATNRFEPVDVDGVTVHPMFSSEIAAGELVRVTWVAATSPRVQGLGVRLRLPNTPGARGRGGLLRVHGEEAPTMLLWMDTAPAVVDVACVKVEPGAQLQVSNRWRSDDGTEDEWLNNYGLIIETLDSRTHILHCSDGHGSDPSVDDLTVRIEIRPASS